jgi:spore germination protein GerM
MIRRILVAAAMLLALAGCGVGSQRHAVAIPSGDLPSVLLQPAASPSASVVSQTPTSTIYLVESKHLVGVHRPRSQTETVTSLIRSLLKGPTDAEAASGLSTAINTSPTLNKVTVVDSVAIVDLGSSFGDIRGPEQVLATAQVVLTAVSFPTVSSVQISLDGTPAAVPLADGTLSTAPLDASDYASLLGTASPSP